MLARACEILKTTKEQYLRTCRMNESEQWVAAYEELYHNGVLTDYKKYRLSVGKYRYIYLYAKYKGMPVVYLYATNGSGRIYMTEYNYFKDLLMYHIVSSKMDMRSKCEILAGLRASYKDILVQYISRLFEEHSEDYDTLYTQINRLQELFDASKTKEVTTSRYDLESGMVYSVVYRKQPVVTINLSRDPVEVKQIRF